MDRIPRIGGDSPEIAESVTAAYDEAAVTTSSRAAAVILALMVGLLTLAAGVVMVAAVHIFWQIYGFVWAHS